jgi:hypothetical protein
MQGYFLPTSDWHRDRLAFVDGAWSLPLGEGRYAGEEALKVSISLNGSAGTRWRLERYPQERYNPLVFTIPGNLVTD